MCLLPIFVRIVEKTLHSMPRSTEEETMAGGRASKGYSVRGTRPSGQSGVYWPLHRQQLF